MKKIAMFGGSFNPVHLGHTGLVSRMVELFGLDMVYVVPTLSTPLKDNTPMLSPLHRLNMCKLAFEDFDNVEVSDMEIFRGGVSYTVDTLTSLRDIHKDCKLFLMIGADSFLQLPLWHKAESIFSLATILTVTRDEINADALITTKRDYEQKYNAEIFIVKDPIAPISSTFIRNAIKCKEEYKHLLPVRVSDYIKTNGLYDYED